MYDISVASALGHDSQNWLWERPRGDSTLDLPHNHSTFNGKLISVTIDLNYKIHVTIRATYYILILVPYMNITTHGCDYEGPLISKYYMYIHTVAKIVILNF